MARRTVGPRRSDSLWTYVRSTRIIGGLSVLVLWAAGRGHDRVLAAAAAFQRGERRDPPDAAAVAPLVEEARRALVAEMLESPDG